MCLCTCQSDFDFFCQASREGALCYETVGGIILWPLGPVAKFSVNGSTYGPS